MPDNTLQFETRVDLSGLNSGTDQAKAKIQDLGKSVTQALSPAQQAVQNLAEAQIALGAAAAQGSAEAAAVIREYQQAVDETSNSVREFAATEVEETTALRAGTSARMAASAELRVFEGNMQGSTRAAAAFLSQLPGIGSAMQAAFPIFGAIALAEILVQVAEKVHNVYNEYYNLYSLQQSVMKNILADETTEIELSNQRLSQLREQRVLAAELSGPKQGRSNRGQQAGANFDTHIDTVDLQNAKDLVTSTTQRLKDLQTAAQGTDVAHALGQGGVIITKEMTLEAREAAKLIPQVTEDLQKYSDTVTTIQQKMQTDTMRSALMGKEATEKETPKQPSVNRIQLMIEEQNQQLTLDRAFHDQLQAGWEADYRAQAESYSKGEEADRERTEMFKKNQKEMADAAQSAAQAAHEHTLGGIQTQTTKVQAGQALGLTDPAKDLQALQQLHQQALAEDERFIKEEIAIYADEPKRVEELQKQLDLVIQKGQQQQLQDSEKVLAQQVTAYKKAYQEITQDLNSAINKIVVDGQKPGVAFTKMLSQMLTQLATFIEQYLEKKAEMWILDAVLGKTSQTTAAVSSITANAAVAASGAAAATAAIPIVGPALAPAAAAAMFATTISYIGLAAFEQGGIVGGHSGQPVPIMAHAGERVLTAGQTNKFENMVNSSSNNGGNRLTYSPTIHGSVDKGMLDEHSKDMMTQFRKMVRPEALA